MLKLKLLVIIILLASCSTPPPSHYQKGEKYRKQEKYEKAIEAYQLHINQRLAVKNRPEWENPYIYLLDIGDIYLSTNQPEKAREHYELAEQKEVKSSYVNDRYRHLARWHEEQGMLYESILELNRYKDRDPDLFNLILDRIAKKIVDKESQAQ